PVSSDEEMISGPPIRLDIKSADISIEISDGVYNKQRGTWTLSNDKAHFAVGTSQPNNVAGNTFIYGHNRREVFARITKLVGGEEAKVTTANGHVFVYKLVSRRVVSPTDVSVFAYDGPPILTVQTCTGLFY